MKILLAELRSLIGISLLNEVDIAKLGARFVNTKDRAIVTSRNNVIVISTKVSDSGIPEVHAAANFSPMENSTYMLSTLFSDNAPDAILVLYASLKLYKRVVPDWSVSPAAQAVIKRYFDDHKNDPTRIELDEKYSSSYLKATYLEPPGPEIDVLTSRGKDILRDTGISITTLESIAHKKFQDIYNDPVATGVLSGKNAKEFEEAKSGLISSIEEKDPKKIRHSLLSFNRTIMKMKVMNVDEDEQFYYPFVYQTLRNLEKIHNELAKRDPKETWLLSKVIRSIFKSTRFMGLNVTNKAYDVVFYGALDTLHDLSPTDRILTNLIDAADKMFINNKESAPKVINDVFRDLKIVRDMIDGEPMAEIWDEIFKSNGYESLTRIE